MRCPCGTGEAYAACCGPLHTGAAAARTAVALMRSRYSAYALGDADYVLRTWHPSTRPHTLDLDDGVEWRRLHVVDTEDGGFGDTAGVVEFVARFRLDATSRSMRERSEFVRVDGGWLYLRGAVTGDWSG